MRLTAQEKLSTLQGLLSRHTPWLSRMIIRKGSILGRLRSKKLTYCQPSLRASEGMKLYRFLTGKKLEMVISHSPMVPRVL